MSDRTVAFDPATRRGSGLLSHKARRRLWIGFGVALILVFSLGPFLWLADASFTPEPKADFAHPYLSTRSVIYFPSHPTIANYFLLFQQVPFAMYFRNSLIIASGNMLLTLVVASLGAYGIARFRFVGRGAVLVGILVTYTVPSVVLLVPLLVIFRTYGLNNTHLGMIFAEATHSAPFALLLLVNYFATLPKELEEAAEMDGCGRLRALWSIILPLSLPGLMAAGLLAFMSTWNDFLFAYLFTATPDVMTLPVIMRQFALGEPAAWSVSAAGALLSTLPVALIFLLFQRMLITGLAAGAVKG